MIGLHLVSYLFPGWFDVECRPTDNLPGDYMIDFPYLLCKQDKLRSSSQGCPIWPQSRSDWQQMGIFDPISRFEVRGIMIKNDIRPLIIKVKSKFFYRIELD